MLFIFPSILMNTKNHDHSTQDTVFFPFLTVQHNNEINKKRFSNEIKKFVTYNIVNSKKRSLYVGGR